MPSSACAGCAPERVPENVYRCVACGRFLIQAHLKERLIVAAKRLLPVSLYPRLLSRLAPRFLPRRRRVANASAAGDPTKQNV